MKRIMKQVALSALAATMLLPLAPTAASAGEEPFVGEIQYVAFNWAPQGWQPCNGQILQINTNQALFSLLNNQFGGNYPTTFALPDLRGRVPVHMGQGTGLTGYTFASKGGNEASILIANNLPPHTHPATATSTSTSTVASGTTATSTLNAAVASDSPTAGGNALANSNSAMNKIYSATAPTVAMKPGSVTTTLNSLGVNTNTTTNVTVNNNTTTTTPPAASNLQPYLTLNAIIATNGIYPMRP